MLGMERVAGAGDPLRARAGTCGGSARGPNSGSKVPRQGCRECVCGCARARAVAGVGGGELGAN